MVMTNRAATEQCVAAGGGEAVGGKGCGLPLWPLLPPPSRLRTAHAHRVRSPLHKANSESGLGVTGLQVSSRKGKLFLRSQEKKKRGVRGVA